MRETIKTIIVEDEIEGMKNLEYKLNTHCPEIEIVDACYDVETAIVAIKQNRIDLLLLDVRLGNESSFDILAKLDQIYFDVIFITGYSDYAINAIKYNALDYLLKPVKPAELIKAIYKVKKNLSQQKKARKIAVSNGHGIEFIYLSNILYCLADDTYTKIYLVDKIKPILVTKTLKFISTKLTEENFLRIGRSAVVNLDYVSSFRKSNGGFVVMQNGDELSVSKDKREELLSKVIY